MSEVIVYLTGITGCSVSMAIPHPANRFAIVIERACSNGDSMRRLWARSILTALLTFPLLLATTDAEAQPMTVTADRASGVYAVGETVRWTIEWTGDGAAPAARYMLKSGGLKEVGQADLSFTENIAKLETKLDAPNTMLVEVKWDPEKPANRAFGGAVAAPEQIKPAAPLPDDFDAFWKTKL